MNVTVIGAGLAGSECAWQLAQRGVKVTLCEMKPEKKTPAHLTDHFAELCCSNSLRSNQLENAVGLLKEEMRRLGGLIIQCADETRVEAGGALAVDRHGFAALVTEKIRSHPNITVVPGEVNCYDIALVPTANVFLAGHRMEVVIRNQDDMLGKLSRSGVYLMQKIRCPGVLVECGFLSNPGEEEKLRDPEYQKKLCAVIAAAVCQYLSNT